LRHGPQRVNGVGKGLGLSLETSEQVIKSSKKLSYPFFVVVGRRSLRKVSHDPSEIILIC